jgi:hypothetical protein
MRQMKKLEEQVGAWPNVSVHPHRFGGRELRFGSAELGHLHVGGTVDIPLPAPFAMHSWRTAWRMSIAGFPIQGGLHFTSAVRGSPACALAHALVVLALDAHC